MEAKNTHPSSGVESGQIRYGQTISTHIHFLSSSYVPCVLDSGNTKPVGFDVCTHVAHGLVKCKQIC